MRLNSRLLSFLFAVIAALAAAPATAECPSGAPSRPMQFMLAEADGQSWIVARGRIGPTTAQDFARFLEAHGTPPGTVLLHSHGGRLQTALALGREFRAAGLATRVGEVTDCPDGEARVEGGVCLSSCAYAFLGGVRREIGTGSHLGFHRFYPAAGQGEIDAETLHAASLRMLDALRAYAAEMGTNPTLPEIAARVAEDSLFLPRGSAISALGIETGPDRMAAAGAGLAAQL